MAAPARSRPPLVLPSARLVGFVALLGAVAGPLFDQIHVQLGVLHYPRPDILGQPLWVYPQFAVASVLMALSYRLALPWLPARERTPVGPGQVLVAMAVFVGLYFCTALFWRHEWLLAAALVALFVARVAFDGGWPATAHAVVCAAVGVTWEASISALGAFAYDVDRSLFGVPAWLPGLYLHAALFLRQVARQPFGEAPAPAAAAGAVSDP